MVEDLAVEAAVSMVLEAGEPSVSTEDTCFVAVVVVSFGAPVEYFDCSWDVEPESVFPSEEAGGAVVQSYCQLPNKTIKWPAQCYNYVRTTK